VLARSNLSYRPDAAERLGSGAKERHERAPGLATTGIRLAELLGRLSLAFDIANDARYGRGVRCAVLAVELGRLSGATNEDLRDTFWVSLLRYLGCMGSVAEPAPARSGDPTTEQTRQDASFELAQVVGAGPRILSALGQLCKSSDVLAVPTRLLRIAQSVEAEHQRHGQAGAVAHVRLRAGGQLDSRLAQVFVDGQRELFSAIEDPRIFDRFLDLEPKPVACADEDRVDDVARTLAIVADLGCPLFVGHSTAVAALAERAAGQLGLGPEETRLLRRAAFLHDIGRLGVPSSIWMRPGRLDWGEMERVRLHAYYTERVLSPITILGPVAEIAAAAHERLDGTGYSQSRVGRSLLPAARILAVADMVVAMGEARPYREPLSGAAIAQELVGEVRAGHVDAAAAEVVLASLGLKTKTRIVPRHTNVSDRELEVCRLIARGKMNKEIADVLGISLRTVQNHVAHIFDKLGIHNRSGVAVWLVGNDFIQ
jgi:DNA-binding CsgD family transcriptional regulator